MRGLVRVGAAVPSLALGNGKENMKRHLAMMREAKDKSRHPPQRCSFLLRSRYPLRFFLSLLPSHI